MARFPVMPKRSWSRVHAAHLAARAGFGATPAQLDRLEAMSPEDAVEALLAGPASVPQVNPPAWFTEPDAADRFPEGHTRESIRKLAPEERQKLQQRERRRERQNLIQGRAWWLERMAASPHPLEEKLTLFWHGHFATSIQKVKAAYPMLAQNLMFREKGLGDWPDLVEAVSKDPAMLVYLDNARSNRRKPNENYARELLELFTLGEGHYDEDDIRNAARAFTGWSIDAATWSFQERKFMHDPGHKRFMGDSGRFNGRDIIDRVMRQPRAAEFLAERLWTFFASDAPHPRTLADLAAALRESDYRIADALRVLFLHQDFYHRDVIRAQIKSPVQLTVQLVRALEIPSPPGAPMAEACRKLGQALFDPPSVKGWDGGAAWITASTLALRYDLAEKLIRARAAVRPDILLPDRRISRVQAREQLFDRFYQHPLSAREQQTMDAVLAALPPPADWSREDLVRVLLHIVQQPQYQLT